MKKTDRLSCGFGLIIFIVAFWGLILSSNCNVYAQATDFSQLINNRTIYPEPVMSRPDLLKPYIDPIFGTKITRITDWQTRKAYVLNPKFRHFNSNSTYMFLAYSGGKYRMYNAQTYAWIKDLDFTGCVGGIVGIPLWHPTNPKIVFYNCGLEARKRNVDTGVETVLRTFSGFGWSKTELSTYGAKISAQGTVMLAGWTGGNRTHVFVYDYINNIMGTPLAINPSNHFSISASGNYATIQNYQFYSVDPTTRDITWVRQELSPWDHGDYGYLANGDDIYGTLNSGNNWQYYKKLKDGTTTNVYHRNDYGHKWHGTMDCTNKKGWMIVSQYGDLNVVNDGVWELNEDEIFAIKMDGSGEVRRLAHHHSSGYDSSCNGGACSYYAQAHPAANSDCTKFLFSSNWGDVRNNGFNVDTYIIDLSGSGSPVDTVAPAPPANLQVVLN
jgi:hypothetical protein